MIFHGLMGLPPVICSITENEKYKVAMFWGANKYFIAVAKNNSSEKEFEDWYWKKFNNETTEAKDKKLAREKNLQLLANLVNDNEKFELIEGEKAYTEFLRISNLSFRSILPKDTKIPLPKYPAKPTKDFNLLREWYFNRLEIERNEFYQTAITDSPEMLNTIELELIERLSNEINTIYFPKKETEYDKHLHRSLLTEKVEFTANKTFLNWLNEKKNSITEKKLYSVEEETKIQGINNWSDIQRVYLLKLIGIDELKTVKELGQIKKYELIANILNCSPRKAKENYNHYEKKLTFEKKEDVKNYLKKISEEK